AKYSSSEVFEGNGAARNIEPAPPWHQFPDLTSDEARLDRGATKRVGHVEPADPEDVVVVPILECDRVRTRLEHQRCGDLGESLRIYETLLRRTALHLDALNGRAGRLGPATLFDAHVARESSHQTAGLRP